MHTEIASEALAQLFTDARSHFAWTSKEITDAQLQRMVELAKFAPTGANTNPLRIVFVRSVAAKELLKPCLDAGNVDKTMTAKVTAILARDTAFYKHHGRLFPHMDLSKMFEANPDAATGSSTSNGWLQCAYFMLAARAIGVDCGPMGGFDKAKVNSAFLAGTGYESLMLCNLGYGDASKLHPRQARFSFEEMCKIV
jgi:3-hydroxypropanoate dehydrogenase